LIAIYFILRKDLDQSMIYSGLALIFDPFDESVKWSLRPKWQKCWLIVHLGIQLILIIFTFKNLLS
jgi:hypothetical protein